MNSCANALPEAPPGVDPAVLANINALFAQPAPRPLIAQQEVSATTETLTEECASMPMEEGAWFGSSSKEKKKKPAPKEEMKTKVQDSTEDESRHPRRSQSKLREMTCNPEDFDVIEPRALPPKQHHDEEDEDDHVEYLPIMPSSDITDPAHPRILTRTIYPSMRTTRKKTPPPLPPRRSSGKPKTPKDPIEPPSLSMLFFAILAFLSDIIFNCSPDIVEYSDRQIRRTCEKIVVRVEAQEVEFPSAPTSTSTSPTATPFATSTPTSTTPTTPTSTPPNGPSSGSSSDTSIAEPGPIVGVVALLHVDDGKHGGRVIEIKAKPLRVRELLWDEGDDVVENMYGVEIRGALRRLGRKMSVREKQGV